MKFLRFYWQKICEPLDGFLWHRDITHPVIRPLLRNEILGSGFCLLAGAALYAVFPWLFWFGAGLACLTWIFWGWANFFGSAPLKEYSAAFLRAVLLRFGLRFVFLAFLLYLALAVCHAPPSALLGGMIAGSILALAVYALKRG